MKRWFSSSTFPFLTLTEEKMAGQATLLLRLGKLVQGGGLFLGGERVRAGGRRRGRGR